MFVIVLLGSVGSEILFCSFFLAAVSFAWISLAAVSAVMADGDADAVAEVVVDACDAGAVDDLG